MRIEHQGGEREDVEAPTLMVVLKLRAGTGAVILSGYRGQRVSEGYDQPVAMTPSELTSIVRYHLQRFEGDDDRARFVVGIGSVGFV